jgi:predicted glycosyltransferase
VSKQGSRTRWGHPYVPRYNADRKIDDVRWIKKRGRWVLEEKQRTEPDYCFVRRSPVGFHRGARVRVFKQQTTLPQEASDNG